MNDFLTVAGPTLVAGVMGAMYGITKVYMNKPLPTTTRGWTEHGSRFKLTRHVAQDPALAFAFLNLADRNDLEYEDLRKLCVLAEQIKAAEAWAEEQFSKGGISPDVVIQVERLRSRLTSFLMNALDNAGIKLGSNSLPQDPATRYDVSVILQSINSVIFNLRLIPTA